MTRYRVITASGLVCQEWDTIDEVYEHAQALAKSSARPGLADLHPKKIQESTEVWDEWETIEDWPV